MKMLLTEEAPYAESEVVNFAKSLLDKAKEKVSDLGSKIKSFAQEHPALAASIPAALAAGAGAAALLKMRKQQQMNLGKKGVSQKMK